MKLTIVFTHKNIIEKRTDLITVSRDYPSSAFFEYEDDFGRKWKLTPVTNENIKFPFIIEPIGDMK